MRTTSRDDVTLLFWVELLVVLCVWVVQFSVKIIRAIDDCSVLFDLSLTTQPPIFFFITVYIYWKCPVSLFLFNFEILDVQVAYVWLLAFKCFILVLIIFFNSFCFCFWTKCCNYWIYKNFMELLWSFNRDASAL